MAARITIRSAGSSTPASGEDRKGFITEPPIRGSVDIADYFLERHMAMNVGSAARPAIGVRTSTPHRDRRDAGAPGHAHHHHPDPLPLGQSQHAHRQSAAAAGASEVVKIDIDPSSVVLE
jgi:hypothetical protein